MRFIKSILTIAIFFGLGMVTLQAQSKTTKPIKVTEKKDNRTPAEQLGIKTFQIYLEEPIQKVKDVEYKKDGKKIEFELSPDGTKIYIHDYDYRNSVKVKYINANGKEEEIVRSRCSIDPILQS